MDSPPPSHPDPRSFSQNLFVPSSLRQASAPLSPQLLGYFPCGGTGFTPSVSQQAFAQHPCDYRDSWLGPWSGRKVNRLRKESKSVKKTASLIGPISHWQDQQNLWQQEVAVNSSWQEALPFASLCCHNIMTLKCLCPVIVIGASMFWLLRDSCSLSLEKFFFSKNS